LIWEIILELKLSNALVTDKKFVSEALTKNYGVLISGHGFVPGLIQAVQIRLEAGRGETKFVADGNTSTRNLHVFLIWLSKILLSLYYVT
jgi:hypothetical protein